MILPPFLPPPPPTASALSKLPLSVSYIKRKGNKAADSVPATVWLVAKAKQELRDNSPSVDGNVKFFTYIIKHYTIKTYGKWRLLNIGSRWEFIYDIY
jgi:hypothetical protein